MQHDYVKNISAGAIIIFIGDKNQVLRYEGLYYFIRETETSKDRLGHR